MEVVRILMVTHYFPPEIGAPQARLSDLARFWTRRGEQVTVLTGMPNHPTGVIPPAYRGKLRWREQVDGYRVVRTWLYATPNEGVLKKTLGHISFMVTSVLLGRPGAADVVLASSPTFFSIFSAWFLAKVRRVPFVLEIRDLWPAIFVELGLLRSRALIALLERMELWAYHAADAVVVVSEGFREHLIRRGIAATKVHTIRNGVDLERFAPAAGDSMRARARLGARGDQTLVLYIGAHGMSHGLPAVADAAARLAHEPIHFAFVGEGAAKGHLERRVHQLGLADVTMLPGVPREQVPELVAAADICLVPLRDLPLFSTFIPSKIFEFLGSGKAIVGSVRGEPAAILREAGASVVDPEAVEDIAGAIRQLAGDPSRRREMGARGRAYVERHFDRERLADSYRELLQAVVGRSDP